MINAEDNNRIRKFENRVSRFINREKILEKVSAPVIVALSGGADSVALLSLLSALGYECVAAHCNFHLRGEESMRDQRFVECLCRRLGVELFFTEFNVEERMGMTGESVEMACRELRYAWFHRLCEEKGACAVAVGHHREDQAETVMLNLIRGTGIAGVAGMRPRNGIIVRPLLECSRNEIEDYLQASGISYIVDSSNASNVYKRNKIRNLLLPYLDELFPGATEGILRSVSNLSDNRDLYQETVVEKQTRWINGDTIDLETLLGTERYPRIVLYEILAPYGFNMSQIRDIISSSSRSGAFFDSAVNGKIRLELSHGKLLIVKEPEHNESECFNVLLSGNISQPFDVEVSEHDISEFTPERDGALTLYLDSSALEGAALWQFRRPVVGDRMRPFGMNGSKLVSDLFADAKYASWQKRKAWVFTRNGEILWIPGVRTSAHFPVDENTKRFVRLKIK